MVCTGLSMLDFKVQVKHSMEALLTRYGKQATALPVQPPPVRGTTLDRQHQSKSKRLSQQQGRGQGHSREDVPLGLKATRVAHAAAVSSRVFLPSMRSPFSGQGELTALPSQHELEDTLGFVQRQGSFHSEHAIQHLMTDQPYPQPSSRHLTKHIPLPSQRSLHQRDSADSNQRQSSMPRQSFQTDASDHQSQHSHVSAPRAYSSSRHSQQDSQGSHSQRPPLANSHMIAHSALFQTVPVSPRNGHMPTDHHEHTEHGPHGLPLTAGTSQHSYQHSEHYDQQPQHHAQTPSLPTAVDRHDRYHADNNRQREYQPDLKCQSAAASTATAGVGVPLSAFQSADSFASDMLSSDNNQTAQWDNSVLQHIQEGSEAAAPQQDASALPDAALQSADSFASDPLSTDMTHTAHWGKRMLSELHQVAEEERQQEVQTHPEAQHAEPAALGSLEAEGMHPPIDQAEAGPHDWLWLPDELSSIRDSDLSSIDGGRPDIDTWLAQQQASRLASTAQHAQHSGPRTAQRAQHGSDSFKAGGRLQQAVSPTSPLNTADTLDMDSIYDEGRQHQNSLPKASSSLPWAEHSSPATGHVSQRVTPSHAEGHVPVPKPDTFQPQSAGYTSPFAHWSPTPILGSNTQPDQAAVTRFDDQQQQQRQTVPHWQAGMLQGGLFDSNEACAKQQELDSRLAALDLLEFPGEGDMFEGFGSPLQTRHTGSGQARAESLGSQLYNTEAPLPVDAPGATLSAPEEALLASMKEMLHGEPCLVLGSIPVAVSVCGICVVIGIAWNSRI